MFALSRQPCSENFKLSVYLTDLLLCVQPILGEQAVEVGLVDRVLCDAKSDFSRAAELAARQLRYDYTAVEALLERKRRDRTPSWFAAVEANRTNELKHMKVCFASDEYNASRRAFVHKAAASSTPQHLLHPWPVVNAKHALVLEACWDGTPAGEAASVEKFEQGRDVVLRTALLDDELLNNGISARFPIE